jgi:hypothetical protein
VSVADFDWWLLKDDTGAYGKKALTRLAASPKADIAAKAKAALADRLGPKPSRNGEGLRDPAPKPTDLEKIPVIFPLAAKLPESFIATDFSGDNQNFSAPGCLRVAPPVDKYGPPACKAALLDLNADGVAEVLVREGPNLTIFTQRNGVWLGNQGYLYIGSLEADFDSGKLKADRPIWNDVVIGEQRKSFSMRTNEQDSAASAAAAANAAVDEKVETAPDQAAPSSK